MSPPELIATHTDPVWRDRADFIINARLPEGGRLEQLWAQKLADDRFVLCCIPFFLYDVALGDVIETESMDEWPYLMRRVLAPSGRAVFRAHFARSQLKFRAGVAKSLEELGASLEWSSPGLVAIDIDGSSSRRVADFLQEREDARWLEYETGRS